MLHLSLQLFGSFQASLDGQPIKTFESDKVRGLLIYLAVEAQQPHPREKLAGLFWPDFSEKSARTNLRRALANLRQAIKDEQAAPRFLNITRQTIQFNRKSNYTLDVTSFLTASANDEASPNDEVTLRESQAKAYQDSFLPGFLLAESQPFEEWITFKRELFRRTILESLQTLVGYYEVKQAYPLAISHAYRLVDLEPWFEEGHQALMRLLAFNNQRSVALEQFEVCRQALLAGLGVEPSEETRTLYEQIKAGEFSQESASTKKYQTAKISSALPTNNLPAQITPFVGRETELNDLARILSDPEIRLITIIGAGGIGKSHLSLEIGRRLLAQFANGVFFVALAPIQHIEQIIPVIAEAVSYPLQSDGRSPEQQLQDFFRQKSLLLILDNMEHLLDGISLISNLLQAAPDLKILVTSRERLKLQSETVYTLAGLAVSEMTSTNSLNDDAVQLFYKTAQRIQSDLEITAEHTQTIATICRFVEGMPLAIVLAAGWADQLTLAEIATELTADTGLQLNLLETDWRDFPERHQRIHTVFDHSWRRLTEAERQVFMALSVFRGGFTREAAQTVTNASLPTLTNLVNKSLLTRTVVGRYAIHELLRQFGALELEASSNYISVRKAHSAYYAQFLEEKGAELKGAKQIEALSEIEQEADNIRQAWDWVIEQHEMTQIARMIEGLGMFYDWKGRYMEGEMAFRVGAERLSRVTSHEGVQNYVRLFTWRGVFIGRLGNTKTALELLQDSLKLIDQTSSSAQMMTAEKAFNLWQQGKLMQNRNFGDARRLYEDSLALFQAIGDQWHSAYLLCRLGDAIGLLSPHENDLKLQLLQDSLTLHQTLGNGAGAAETLTHLGFDAVLQQGDFEQCEAWYDQAITIHRQNGNEVGLRQSLRTRGTSYLVMGRFDDAFQTLQEALGVAKHLGSLQDIMNTSSNLSMTETFLGHYEQGIRRAQTVLDYYRQEGSVGYISYALLHLGRAFLGKGDYQNAYLTLQESVKLDRSSKANDRLYTVLSSFGLAAWHRGQVTEAKSVRDEILVHLAGGGGYFIEIGLMPLVALLHLSQDNPVRAIELYALALTQPHVRNNQWYADVVGKHIDEAAKNLPPEVVTAAQKRGRVRDLRETIQELTDLVA